MLKKGADTFCLSYLTEEGLLLLKSHLIKALWLFLSQMLNMSLFVTDVGFGIKVSLRQLILNETGA